MMRLYSKIPLLMLTLIVGLLATSTAYASATIVIQNNDAAGVGFNDPTPATPVGGNAGTTVGQQRLNAFQFAANIWGATITSGPTITIRASWASLSCTANSGTLGQAGATSTARNFSGALYADTVYSIALANALANTDLNGPAAEINAQFNSSLGTSGCLENLHWYYGLNTNTDFQGINLVAVLLHEFAHGFGFQTFTSVSSGAQSGGFPSIYDRFLFDNTTGKTWSQMTNSERVASAINTNNLGWNGPRGTTDASLLSAGKDASGRPLVHTPGTVQGGSSVSHWSTSATPNQLMEPNISSNLSHSVTPPQDLTFSLLSDIGWCVGCPPPSPTPTPSPTPSPSPPANDNFANAQTISDCSGSVAGTNVGATKQPGEPSHSPDGDLGGGSIWYQWQAPASGSVTMTTEGSLNDDTVLAVYTGNSVTALTTIIKNDDVDPGNIRTSTVTFPATSGTLYKIAVDGWDEDIDGTRGPILLNWNLSGCQPTKADQTITFNPLANKGFGDAPFNVSASSSSGLPISFSVTSGPATVAGSTVTITGAGLVTVRASQAGDANFNAATPVDRTFTVNKSDQTISFGPLFGKTFGDPAFTVSASASSNLPVSFSVLSGPATVSGNTVTITDVGTVTIRASQAGDENFITATPVDQSFVVVAPTFDATTLTVSEVELKSWTVEGRTYAYVKLLYPNAGYRVTNWGQTTNSGNDFTVDAAVEKFNGASVQAVTTTAQIYDLGPLANGTYNFNFKTSGTLVKSLQFTVSSAVPPPNPIDDARTFVKQQYRDFLNREADQAGEDFWTDNITKCMDPARRPPGQTVEQCTLRQRETTSGAFFLSPEFQYTGYFVYRIYQGALGRPPKLSEFTPDALTVGNGIIVNGQLSGAKINQNKADFTATFVNCVDATKSRCAEFKAIYDTLSNQAYVDKLFQTTGVNASASDRAALVSGLDGGTESRASVLQKVVDGINVISEGNQQFTTTYGQAFYNAELNRAFVQLEYFGYMRRDPDEGGYAFWLGKLNQFGGDFIAAEMVLAFISSPEYRARFGQP